MNSLATEEWFNENAHVTQTIMTELVLKAEALVDHTNNKIKAINRLEGPNVFLRLRLQQRRAIPELIWVRYARVSRGGQKRTSYVAGLRNNCYRRDAFAGVPQCHIQVILEIEQRCVQIRRSFKAVAGLIKSLDEVRSTVGVTVTKSGRKSLDEVGGFDTAELYR